MIMLISCPNCGEEIECDVPEIVDYMVQSTCSECELPFSIGIRVEWKESDNREDVK